MQWYGRMSLSRAVTVVGAVFVFGFVVLLWRSRPAAAPETTERQAAQVTAQAAVAQGVATPMSASPRAPAPGPSLLDQPFAGQELAMTSDVPDAPVIALRSSTRSGRELSIELATREPAPDGAHVFATVSVSDALGNTILDCTWRDVELTDDARKLDCELPADVALPLTMSGHQRSSASFVENPIVVAVDKGAH